MTDHPILPPFEISDEVYINDRHGTICTADSPRVARMLVQLLNHASGLPASVQYSYSSEVHEPPRNELTADQVFNWIELALLRERDRATHHNASSDVSKMLTNICDHLIEFRREFNEHD